MTDPTERSRRAEYSRRWRERHPERARESQRKYRETHREKVLERTRQWRANNLDYARAKVREYRAEHRDETSATFKEWAARNRQKRWAYWLRYRHGLTEEQFFEMLVRQEGRCAICRADVDRLEIDHDHATEERRGLLCIHCNRMLGHAKDDPDVLRRAADYLEGHR